MCLLNIKAAKTAMRPFTLTRDCIRLFENIHIKRPGKSPTLIALHNPTYTFLYALQMWFGLFLSSGQSQ